jgi:hypothetical protein
VTLLTKAAEVGKVISRKYTKVMWNSNKNLNMGKKEGE